MGELKDILSEEFDQELKSKIEHFSSYPEMIPFVGKKWHDSKKVLLLGESHYLPYADVQSDTNFDYLKHWYEGNSKSFKQQVHRDYLNTRNNVKSVEFDKPTGPLLLYFNLKRALLETSYFESTESVFDKFSFYNYFQRPAVVKEKGHEDRSIILNDKDGPFAHSTLIKVIEIISPKYVIFSSVKSYDAFMAIENKEKTPSLDMVVIDFVPHAGKQWWSMESNRYATKDGKKRKGKDKFVDLINEIFKES